MSRRAQSNYLDRAIGYVSPTWQFKRIQKRSALQVLARYYEAGDVSRRTEGWKRPKGDANAVSGVSLARLRDSARHLVRNNGYAESGLGTIVDDVVGWGILPTSKNEAWKDWAESTAIDAEGRLDLVGLQMQVIRTIVESGECLIRRRWRRLSDRLPIPLQIEVLEPDFLDSSKNRGPGEDGRRIVKGVEFDKRGQRIAYWLFKENPGSSTFTSVRSLGVSERVPANEILHVYKPGRPGQVRGVSWFAPVLLRFNDFDEFADATLMKQKIAACLAVITSDVDGSSTQLGATDPNNVLHDILEPGLIATIPAGRNVDIVNPPTVREYADYTKTTLHEIASGLGVTPEDLTGDYSNLNFSAARMSRLRHFGRVQGWRWRMMIPQFLTPLWGWAMAALELAGGEVMVNEDWTAPPLPMIEPDKEGLAITRNIRSGIMTPSEAIRERGYDVETFLEEYSADFAELDRRGIVLDSDPRKMTQAGQAQFSTPFLSEPPDGPPEEEGASSTPSNGNGEAEPESRAELELRAAGTLIPVSEAAKRFNLNPATIRLWVKKGAIPSWRLGPRGTIRVRPADFLQE